MSTLTIPEPATHSSKYLEGKKEQKMSRSIGPVTSTVGAVTAAVLLVCWALRDLAGITVPADVQGFATVIAVYIAGWVVSPKTALARARAELHKDMSHDPADESTGTDPS